jgi:hypothetical protein
MPSYADKRVALVIGNSAYRNAASLTNPANDAIAVSGLFKSAHFDTVRLALDLGVADLRRAISDFADLCSVGVCFSSALIIASPLSLVRRKQKRGSLRQLSRHSRCLEPGVQRFRLFLARKLPQR